MSRPEPATPVRPDRMIRVGRSEALIGAVLLVVLTAVCSSKLSEANVFVYDNALLASIGAIALTVLIGTAGQVSVGNSAFLAVGAFVSVWCVRAGIPFPADILVATVVSAVAGAVTGLPGVRLRGIELALATLATYFLVVFAASEYQIHTSDASGGFIVNTLFGSSGLEAGQRYWAYLLTVVVVLTALGARGLCRSKTGRAMRIIRDHELVAPTLGVPVLRYKLTVFAMSSALIGLEGGLSAHFLGSVTSDNYTLGLAFQYVVMVVIGGLGSIAGAVAGAFVVTILPTLMADNLPSVLGASTAAADSSQVASIVYFIILIAVVSAAPRGLAGLGAAVSNSRGANVLRRRLQIHPSMWPDAARQEKP